MLANVRQLGARGGQAATVRGRQGSGSVMRVDPCQRGTARDYRRTDTAAAGGAWRYVASRSPAQEPAQVLDAGPGRVHRPIALQHAVFQAGTRHRVDGQRGTVRRRGQIQAGISSSAHRCGPPPVGRPRASQIGAHTIALVPGQVKSHVRTDADRRAARTRRPTVRREIWRETVGLGRFTGRSLITFFWIGPTIHRYAPDLMRRPCAPCLKYNCLDMTVCPRKIRKCGPLLSITDNGPSKPGVAGSSPAGRAIS